MESRSGLLIYIKNIVPNNHIMWHGASLGVFVYNSKKINNICVITYIKDGASVHRSNAFVSVGVVPPAGSMW